MKPDFKFLKAFTWLAWFYLLCVVAYDIVDFSYMDADEGNPKTLEPLKETLFLLLNMYLAYILVYYKERRLIINSFYLYGAILLISLGSFLITDKYKVSNYLEVIGIGVIFSFINFAIQVFKIRNQQLRTSYKNFARALIVFLSAKGALGLYSGFNGSINILDYRQISAYINLTELLIPAAIILLFNATKALQKNPEDSSGPNVVYV